MSAYDCLSVGNASVGWLPISGVVAVSRAMSDGMKSCGQVKRFLA